jgi:methylmalonyl-CoA mutase N-terminal domain/subunit
VDDRGRDNAHQIVGVNAFVDQTGSERVGYRLDPVSDGGRSGALPSALHARPPARRPRSKPSWRREEAGTYSTGRTALAARCTVGEVCGVLREEWGSYR